MQLDGHNNFGNRSLNNWVITWNNPPPNAEERILEHVSTGLIGYVAAGRETAPGTGTYHLQMFVQLSSRRSANFVRGMFAGCWCAPMETTPVRCINYAKKGGNYLERGVPTLSVGKRFDPPVHPPGTDNAATPLYGIGSMSPFTLYDAHQPNDNDDLPNIGYSRSPSAARPITAAPAVRTAPQATRLVDATRAAHEGRFNDIPSDLFEPGFGLPSFADPSARPIRGTPTATTPRITTSAGREAKSEENKQRLIDATRAAKEGRLQDIPEDLLIRYASAIRLIYTGALTRPETLASNSDFCGIWIWGPVNAGKTYAATHAFPGYYPKARGNRWWDKYEKQDYVLMDEVNASQAQLMMQDLKSWTDKEPFIAEIKGGTITIRPKIVCITSNWSIDQCFPDPIDAAAMKKRYMHIHFAYRGIYTPEQIHMMANTRIIQQPSPIAPTHPVGTNLLAMPTQRNNETISINIQALTDETDDEAVVIQPTAQETVATTPDSPVLFPQPSTDGIGVIGDASDTTSIAGPLTLAGLKRSRSNSPSTWL